ncbi:unnamed protein product [Ceratitis capitata]|uniref:(Mediterranean fruit fly) hypothetical protein n=1 Tax=Ceratitis capitata TaxID=7213 RepID=A0A811UTU5_CERCA|nr:unnamed protein product [Ceratitis capitata]
MYVIPINIPKKYSITCNGSALSALPCQRNNRRLRCRRNRCRRRVQSLKAVSAVNYVHLIISFKKYLHSPHRSTKASHPQKFLMFLSDCAALFLHFSLQFLCDFFRSIFL